MVPSMASRSPQHQHDLNAAQGRLSAMSSFDDGDCRLHAVPPHVVTRPVDQPLRPIRDHGHGNGPIGPRSLLRSIILQSSTVQAVWWTSLI